MHDELYTTLNFLTPTDFALLNSAKSGGGLVFLHVASLRAKSLMKDFHKKGVEK